MVCNFCRKHLRGFNEPLARRVVGTAANSSSSSNIDSFVAMHVVDVDIEEGQDIDEGQEEIAQEEHHSSGFIVRSDVVVEPAPGHGKYRPHRKRGKASRAKSRASFVERLNSK